MTAPRIVLAGAGGHALACIDVIERGKAFEIAGLVGVRDEVGSYRLGYSVFASDDDLPVPTEDIRHAIVGVGQIRSPDSRVKLFSMLRDSGYQLPVIVSPGAWVSPHAKIGAGTIVMHGVVVNADTHIGENCILNSGCLLEHGVRVGNHCHISTHAVVNGDVEVGDGTMIGSGCRIKDGVRIGERSLLGIGTTIFSDVAAGTIVTLPR